VRTNYSFNFLGKEMPARERLAQITIKYFNFHSFNVKQQNVTKTHPTQLELQIPPH
jgi:hypothetical protein